MDRISMWALPILIFLLLPKSDCEEKEVKDALILFMDKLSAGNVQRDENFGWNSSSDPCSDNWKGVNCSQQFVKKIVLEGLNLNGILDASSVCMAKSLTVLSVKDNNIAGTLPAQISDCKRLTHLYVNGNRFSGNLPDSLSQLSKLKRLEIPNNNFSGKLPDLPRISGLITFRAENNQLSGGLPDFDFSNLDQFNVSNNNFSGAIPDVQGRFKADSFSGNPGLCGKPLPNACPPTPPKKKQEHSTKEVLLFSGYIIVGLLIVLFVAWRFIRKKKPKEDKKLGIVKKGGVASDTSSTKPSGMSSGLKTGENRSEYSIPSAEGGMAPGSPLVVFSSPTQKGLKFADLLRAPAELLGRGKHGSLYKVTLENGVLLAVKRLKDWKISSEDFRRRMRKIGQAKNPNVLSPVAYYCSKQEKLLVYEYQPNGSLFQLLHGSQNGQTFDWENRLGVAAAIAKALAFMHKELQEDEIAHGNLKSTNILFNKNMCPCISEYGLMVIENEDKSFLAQSSSFKVNTTSGAINRAFKVDVYGFGVILLELLTGKLVQNSGFNLAKWVNSVVREEWTAEVFDRALISEGANEERMVNLLQVALKCINPSPSERPCMNEVAAMIDTLKEEEDRSISLDMIIQVHDLEEHVH